MKHAPLLLLVLSMATACGTQPRTVALDAQTQQQLTADVNAVRGAATRQDPKAAGDTLTALTRHVADAQAAGRLNPTQAQGILAAAARVIDDVQTIPTPTTPPATLIVTVPQATPQPNGDNNNNNGDNNTKPGKHKG
jgi:hypothetical protein